MACTRVKRAGANKCNFSAMADKRVEIYTYTETTDSIGGTSGNWGSPDTVWAYIRPMSPKEVFESEQLQSRVSHEIVIRYQAQYRNTTIASKRIIKFDGRYFEIKGVRNYARDMKSEGAYYQSFRSLENEAIQGDLP